MAPNATESNRALLGIEKLVNTIAEKEGFKTFKSEIKLISTHGANFTSDLYLVSVLEEGKDALNLFAKANKVPENSVALNANEIYKHEVFIYTELADTYRELQERYNVPEHKTFAFPKYYGSNLTTSEEIIIFEDLQAQGFVLQDRFEPLEWEYAKAGVEELAKFHALSFALEKEDPELFDKLIKNNKGGIGNADFDSFQEASKQEVIPKNIALVDSENRSKVQKFMKEKTEVPWTKNFEPISKFSTLVHGDYRMSNILAKYDGNVVTSLKPVDYQITYYGCPLNDLVFFLFSGTDEEFRRRHFERIIEHYHNSLADHLKLLSRDINDIYPKSTFYFELKDKLPFGLEFAISFLSYIFIDPTAGLTIDDFQNAEVLSNVGNNMYAERLNGVVRDFVRWGLL